MWEATRMFLDSNAIGYIDALPALRSQLTSGQQPYRPSRDGHPTAAGHAAIASLVARALAGDAAAGR
jgi:hypothetical protein